MNLGELRTAFYAFIRGSDSDSFVSPAEANRLLNNGMMRLFTRLANRKQGFFEATSLLNEVAGTEEITLPLDFYRLVMMERISGWPLSTATKPVPMHSIRRSAVEGYQARPIVESLTGYSTIPMVYSLVGQKKLVLYPAPQTSATGSIRLTYTFRPALMSADTEVPFQQTAGVGGAGKDDLEEYHDLIWQWAALQAAVKSADADLYGMLNNTYASGVAELDAFLDDLDAGPRFISTSLDDAEMFD